MWVVSFKGNGMGIQPSGVISLIGRFTRVKGPQVVLFGASTTQGFSLSNPFTSGLMRAWLLPKPEKPSLLRWVSYFGKCVNNKIAIKENVLKRGVLMLDNGLCALCGFVMKKNNHIFLHCQVVWKLWSATPNREGLQTNGKVEAVNKVILAGSKVGRGKILVHWSKIPSRKARL